MSAKCFDQLRACGSHKLDIHSQITLKALRGTNMIEQWGTKCMQRFRNCGPPTTGCPWTSFLQWCLSVRPFFVAYQRGSYCTDFYCNFKVGDVFETLIRKIQIWLKSGNKYRLLYAFFLVIPRRLNFICRRFGTLCVYTHLPAYEDGTDRVFRNVGM